MIANAAAAILICILPVFIYIAMRHIINAGIDLMSEARIKTAILDVHKVLGEHGLSLYRVYGATSFTTRFSVSPGAEAGIRASTFLRELRRVKRTHNAERLVKICAAAEAKLARRKLI